MTAIVSIQQGTQGAEASVERTEIAAVVRGLGRLGLTLPVYQRLLADELRVDARYQRPLREGRVREMASAFDPDLLGVLLISERSAQGYYVFDGQHRLAALKAMGYGDQLVPCLVYSGLSVQQEALLWKTSNATRTAPRAGDLFRARLFGNEPMAVAIHGIVRSCGLSLRTDGGHCGMGEIAAVVATERIYRAGGEEGLRSVLTLLQEAWGTEAGTYDPNVMSGMWRFHERYAGVYSRQRLLSQLIKTPRAELERKARSFAVLSAGQHSVTIAYVRALVLLYNAGLRVGLLPEWRTEPNRRGGTATLPRK